MMYRIEAHWETGRGSRPVHMFYLNDKPVSGRSSDVCKLVVGPNKSVVRRACDFAKCDGPIELFMSAVGWQARKP